MDISMNNSIRTNSMERYSIGNNNLPRLINGVEIQVRPSSSKCNITLDNLNDAEVRNNNMHVNIMEFGPLEENHNVDNNFLDTDLQNSFDTDSDRVKPKIFRCKGKMIYNNSNLSRKLLPLQGIVDNEIKIQRKQNYCKGLEESFVQNVNANLSLIKREMSLPKLHDPNKSCSDHFYNSSKSTTQDLENTLHTQIKVNQNQRTFPDSLTLKKMQLAAKDEQLRIVEELVKKKEEEAKAKTWQALNEQEAVLLEKEKVLKARGKAAQRVIDDADRVIEESKFKRKKLNESVTNTSSTSESTMSPDVSVNISFSEPTKHYDEIMEKSSDCNEWDFSSVDERTSHIHAQSLSENVVNSVGNCKIIPFNILSKPTKTRVRRQKRKVLALDMCRVEPRLELSTPKHTYSRKSPRKRYYEESSNLFRSPIHQSDDCQLSQHKIDLPGTPRTMKKEILISDSGTITITQLPKFEYSLNAYPRLSSLGLKEKSFQCTASPILNVRESCPSRISHDCSPSSSSSDICVSFAEKVEKLTSDLHFHSVTTGKERENYMCVNKHESKPVIGDFCEDLIDQPKERISKPISDQVIPSSDSEDKFYQKESHSLTLNTNYSTPIGTISNLKNSSNECDSAEDISFSNIENSSETLYCNNEYDYDQNIEESTEISLNQADPLIITSKLDVENKKEVKVIPNLELDVENCNSYLKPLSDNTNIVQAKDLRNSFSEQYPKDSLSLEQEARCTPHLSMNKDCKKPIFDKIFTNEKDVHPEVSMENMFTANQALPRSHSFIPSKNDIEQKNQSAVPSSEADLIPIGIIFKNSEKQNSTEGEDYISTNICNTEFEKKKSEVIFLSSDTEIISSGSTELDQDAEANMTCDTHNSNVDNDCMPTLFVGNTESNSQESSIAEQIIQLHPLNLEITKEFNQNLVKNICEENVKREGNNFSKIEIISSTTNIDGTSSDKSTNPEVCYTSSNAIYTNSTQDVIPSCSTSYSNNFEKCSNELIYAGNHLENFNSVETNSNAEEIPNVQIASNYSVVEPNLEIDEDASASLDHISNKSNGSFDNSNCDINSENLDTSAFFHEINHRSFNLLSSTLLENCEESSNKISPSKSFHEANSLIDYTDIATGRSLYEVNGNKDNESINYDKVAAKGGRILKLKEWWPNTTSDVQTAALEATDNYSSSVCEQSFEECNNLVMEDTIKMPKKRGRKKGVTKSKQGNSNSEGISSSSSGKCMWISTIIPSSSRGLKSFDCGKCSKSYSSVESFKSHAYGVHNGLVRLKGDSQEFNDILMNDILNMVFKVKKKLICDLCSKAFKSLLGYKYHADRCGKEIVGLYTVCDICNKKLLSTSIEAHKLKHYNRLSMKTEKNCLELKKIKLSVDDSLEESPGRKTRKAAQSCHNQMKLLYSSIDSGCDDSNDKDFVEDETQKYFFTSELKSPGKSRKFDTFNKNISKYGKATCINENCDVVLNDIKHLKLHLLTCSVPESSVTCKICYSTVKKTKVSEHLEECHKDNVSNYSDDDVSEKDENDSVKEFSKTSKCHAIRPTPYHHAIELTENFRKINYSHSLYSTLQCKTGEWIEIRDDQLHLYLSQLPDSPLFRLSKKCSDGWERLKNFEGKVLESGEIFFTGGPIRSSAWCPIPITPDVQPSQYIALSSLNNPDQSFPINKLEKHHGLLQIWRCGNLIEPEIPELALAIAHENGVIWSLDWCPSGIYEEPSINNKTLNRLGLLAAAFSDGKIRIYLIPHPHQLESNSKIFKKNPEFSLCHYDYENLELQCVKVCWCSSKSHSLIAGSFTNGMVCIWNLNYASSWLSSEESCGTTILYPINCISAHSGICSAVSFFPKTEGNHIVTGGSDRTIKFWDLTQPEHPLNVIRKGIVTDSVWLPHWAGSFFSFDDAYSLGKTTTTFRENGFYGSAFRSVLGTNATVWSISGSDWLNAIAQVDEAGEVILSLQHNLNCEISSEKHMYRKRYPLFSVKLEKLNNEESSYTDATQSESIGVSEECESSLEQFVEQPLTYATSVEAYGIKFCDEDYKDISKKDEISLRSKQCSELMEPGPLTIYPLMGASSVSWNNNFSTRSWLFVGLQSGLARIVRIPFLE